MVDREGAYTDGTSPSMCTQKQLQEEGVGAVEEMSVYGSSSSMTVTAESSVLVTTDSVESGLRMRVPRGAMKVVVWPQQKCKQGRFFVKIKELVELNCVHYWYLTVVICLKPRTCQRCNTVLR